MEVLLKILLILYSGKSLAKRKGNSFEYHHCFKYWKIYFNIYIMGLSLSLSDKCLSWNTFLIIFQRISFGFNIVLYCPMWRHKRPSDDCIITSLWYIIPSNVYIIWTRCIYVCVWLSIYPFNYVFVSGQIVNICMISWAPARSLSPIYLDLLSLALTRDKH